LWGIYTMIVRSYYKVYDSSNRKFCIIRDIMWVIPSNLCGLYMSNAVLPFYHYHF
jgi:hypothetical protein